MNLEDWKADYLAYWNLTPGTDEAEEAWRAKLEMEFGPKKRAPMAFVQKDICYDSPIDGRPITNKQARIEDLKRNNCIEYDPGMKQDAQRRLQESEARLDKRVDEHVEREFSNMPARKKEKLAAEIQGGLSADIHRVTPPQKSFREG